MKILKLVWQIVFPFEIEWHAPKQQARRRQPIKANKTEPLNAEEVLEKVRLATRPVEQLRERR